MFAQESILFRFMQGYLEKLLADFTDSDLLHVPAGSVNPPAYILGHLAVTNDFALQLLSQPPVSPAGWSEAFGPGSSPARMQIGFPGKSELLAAIRNGHEHILEAAPNADPTAMAQKHSVPFFKGTPVRTVGDCVALLMTTHFSLHIGQLSVLRRQLGQAPLF